VINPPGVCDREQELIQARIPYTPRGQSATQGLTLNISVPASTKASDGLPVLVFVHGGGFANGSANHPHYDLERLVELSVKIRNPIIAVGVK
jgi:carboxylesterase type B